MQFFFVKNVKKNVVMNNQEYGFSWVSCGFCSMLHVFVFTDCNYYVTCLFGTEISSPINLMKQRYELFYN